MLAYLAFLLGAFAGMLLEMIAWGESERGFSVLPSCGCCGFSIGGPLGVLTFVVIQLVKMPKRHE